MLFFIFYRLSWEFVTFQRPTWFHLFLGYRTVNVWEMLAWDGIKYENVSLFISLWKFGSINAQFMRNFINSYFIRKSAIYKNCVLHQHIQQIFSPSKFRTKARSPQAETFQIIID